MAMIRHRASPRTRDASRSKGSRKCERVLSGKVRLFIMTLIMINLINDARRSSQAFIMISIMII
jgi:hypothetical protein